MTTTAEQHKNGNGKQQSLGAQAAAAASTPLNKDAKEPEKANVADTSAAADEDDEDKEEGEGAKKRTPKKVFICVGEVREFKNNRDAEIFLNSDNAPASFHVIKGNELARRQRVSLG